MTKAQKLTIIGSAVLCVLLIGGALLLSQRKAAPERAYVPPAPPRDVSREELTKSDGRDGRACFVAVDGTVYKIQDFSLWQRGEHKPSNGLAYCGADLTKVIEESPHGRKILQQLIKVGPLKAPAAANEKSGT
ncbi:MAG TPA: hypothetical protein VF572_04240 [Candidatus Saccharimonadales bacterium]|jgi:predicted heme/steroid binding protein